MTKVKLQRKIEKRLRQQRCWLLRYYKKTNKLFSRAIYLAGRWNKKYVTGKAFNFYSWKKLAASLTIMALLISGSFMPLTLARFSDEESTQANAIQTSSLDFMASGDGWQPTDSNLALVTGGVASKLITLAKVGQLDFNYNVIAENFTGDVCDSLNLLAQLDGVQVYAGTLSGFSEGPFVFTQPAEWNFTVSLNSTDTSKQNLTCNFDMAFYGWQIGVASYNATGYFSSFAKVSLDITTGSWTAIELPTIGAGDVVINELMWMGSKDDDGTFNTSDEWLELRNMTGQTIDVSGWEIENASTGSSLVIPDATLIAANGYLTISNYNKADSAIDVEVDWTTTSISLNNNYNTNGQIRLKSGSVIIDATPVPSNSHWPRGLNDNNKKWSMERNLVAGDGTITGSWHTCDITAMSTEQLALMKSFWDVDAQIKNCGTPGHANLSKNDPTAQDYDPLAIITDINEIQEDPEIIIVNPKIDQPEVPLVESLPEILPALENNSSEVTEETTQVDIANPEPNNISDSSSDTVVDSEEQQLVDVPPVDTEIIVNPSVNTNNTATSDNPAPIIEAPLIDVSNPVEPIN